MWLKQLTVIKNLSKTKIFMKIKFDSDDDLLLNKQLEFPTMTIVVGSVFEDDGKFDSQIYLDGFLLSYKNAT